MNNKEMQKRERDERATRRSQLKEAVEEDNSSKKPRLDLLDKLTSYSSIIDILTASGREPLPTLPEDEINNEIKETGSLSTNKHGVLDIFDALPKEAPADDKEGVEVDKILCPLSGTFLQTLIFLSSNSKVAMQDASAKVETLLEEKSFKTFDTSEEEVAAFDEIIAMATTGAEDASSGRLNIADGFDAQAPLAAEDNTPNTR